MSRSSLRRLVTVAASTAVLATVAPSPALAGDMYFSKSSSRFVSTTWVEMGELPGVAGNAHLGDMTVEDLGRGRARVQGIVFDFQCAEGVVPEFPWGPHGAVSEEEPPEEGTGCEETGVRFIDGGQVTFTMDKKLTTATLSGRLVVGHGEQFLNPPVSITWTGVGGIVSERVSGSGVDEFGSYRFRYSFTGRQADVAAGSKIGVMVFDDAPGEYSDALMGSQRSSDRSRS